jgi:propionyl-CoA synthetase
MKHIMDIHKGDVYFSGSDIGWVVGHHFIVYGPLIRGNEREITKKK